MNLSILFTVLGGRLTNGRLLTENQKARSGEGYAEVGNVQPVAEQNWKRCFAARSIWNRATEI